MKRSAVELVRNAWRSGELWVFVATGFRVSASLVMFPLLSRMVPSKELGLWYIFVSLGALFTLLDLGFSAAIVRTTGYIWAGASRLLPFGIERREIGQNAHAETDFKLLNRFIGTLRIYYRYVGMAVFILAGVIGSWCLHVDASDVEILPAVRFAWAIYCLGLVAAFWGGFWQSLLVGIGEVRDAQKAVLCGLLAFYFIGILGLFLGFGIWSLVAGSLMMSLMSWRLAKSLFLSKGSGRIAMVGGADWALLKVIWPNCWRLGLVGFGAYLILQANTLISGRLLGLEATASYGLTLQAIAVIGTISGGWIQACMPKINHYRAAGSLDKVARVFASRMQLFVATYLVGAMALLFLGPWILKTLGARTTLLPPGLLALMLTVLFLEAHHTQYAYLVLSENQNPFLAPALLSGCGVVALSIVLTSQYGIIGMLVAQGLVQLCFNNWWTIWRAIRGLKPADRHYWSYLVTPSMPWKIS